MAFYYHDVGSYWVIYHKYKFNYFIICRIFRHFHLWSNIIFQLIVGILLEIIHGSKRVAIIYFSSVLGGSLFISVLSPQTYIVGASAGLYGLLFSHLSTIILNWKEMDRKCCRLFWLLLYIAFDIGINVFVEFDDEKVDGDEEDVSIMKKFICWLLHNYYGFLSLLD